MGIDLIYIKYLKEGFYEPIEQFKNNCKLIDEELEARNDHVSIKRLKELTLINLKILEYIEISNWDDIRKLNNINIGG